MSAMQHRGDLSSLFSIRGEWHRILVRELSLSASVRDRTPYAWLLRRESTPVLRKARRERAGAAYWRVTEMEVQDGRDNQVWDGQRA
ncbi:hypothetical protein MTO96_037292 [Rhipicephalus appendiculatus]